MLRQKPLVFSLVLAGLIAATDVGALGMGRLNVTTALGQPLVAEVELSLAPGEDADSLRANVASLAAYQAAKVEYQGILQTVRVQVLKRPNGQPYLRLTSTQSINEPYLDILLEVNSSTGRLVREYVFLLDPPGEAMAQAIEPSQPARPSIPVQSAPAAPSTPRPSAPATGSASPAPAPRSNEAAAANYVVKSGDSLSRIAGRNAVPGISLEQLMIAIQRANPDAFMGGNINRLRAGASLNLPAATEAEGISQNTAVSEVRAQAASWRGYVARIADSVPTVANDQGSAQVSGRVSGAVADTGTPANNADKLRLSQGERNKQAAGAENSIAAGKALKEEQSRTAQLEKTKQDLEKALALKNQALADAQVRAKEVSQAPAATPPPAPAVATKVEAAPAIATPASPAAAVTPAVTPTASESTVVASATTVSPPSPSPAAPSAPVATKPAPAKAATTTTSELGMLDFLGDNPVPAAAAGLGVLGLLGVFLWSRRRKQSEPDMGSKLNEPIINTMNPDTVFGTSGLGVIKTNDVPIQSQFSRSGMGTIDSGEVDPVAEAEVYIAYGREAQAEEILREALLRDPQRPDVATKLAEISASQGKRDAFDKLVADITAMDRTGEYKQKLSVIASAHFPDHALAGGSDKASSVEHMKSSSAAAFAAGKEHAVLGSAAIAGAMMSGFQEVTQASGLAKMSEPTPPESASALDFVLDGPEIARPSSMPAAPQSKSLEEDLASLEASLIKATTSGQIPEPSMDFTDFSTATATNLGTVGPSMRPEMLDLSFDAGRQGFVDPTPSILDGQWHDASTKLDLARAYEEMGDREGAREILREVIHDGDEAQQAEAKTLLAKLGG